MTGSVAVDILAAHSAAAARRAAQLRCYPTRTGRKDLQLICTTLRVDPEELVRQEMVRPGPRTLILRAPR